MKRSTIPRHFPLDLVATRAGQLAESAGPDGFFAINDETASGILYACKLVGLKVPDEVSICGFTDGAIAQSTDPKLTTVEQHGEEVGKSAFGILTDKLNGHEGKSTNKIVRTNLVVRGTTK